MSHVIKGWSSRLDAAGTLVLELGKDRVQLQPWDQPRVEVDLMGGDAEALVLSGNPRQLRLARKPGAAELRLVVRAPRQLSLRLVDDASRIALEGFSGRFDLATGGRLEAARLRGELILCARGGEQRVAGFDGRFEVECRGARVELGVDGIDESSKLTVRGGRIDIDLGKGVGASLATSIRRPWRSMSVRAEVGSGEVPIEAHVHRGEIRWHQNGQWMGTLGRNGEVRLAGWDRRRRHFLRDLVSRLQTLG